ncbi:hypothetical protein THIOM_005109 [Candidatus Thiomargarita nelsonii]|uniref:Uncharacterized protein n=1 Tax=Candidatus Thiomargarita nelsonii TaxID=1003181 RepID=A0A176RU33_9GAMM|nr:hypothetical protein THIOM_005109 [Candidatus Thiomargarita nelsonii]
MVRTISTPLTRPNVPVPQLISPGRLVSISIFPHYWFLMAAAIHLILPDAAARHQCI